MRAPWCIALALAFGVSGFVPAAIHAQDRDRDYDRDRPQNYGDRYAHTRFDDRDIRIIRDWYARHPEDVEMAERQERWNPDLERRSQPGQFLDRDVRRWARPVPDELEFSLDPLPRYWRYIIVADHLMIVDDEWRIRDVYHFDEFSDRDRQAIRGWNQEHPDVLRGLLGNFGIQVNVNGDLDRRLQVGAYVDQDLRDRSRPIPGELAERLSPPPEGWQFVIIGDRLVLVDRDWRVRQSYHFERR